jgi:hypothetical protein
MQSITPSELKAVCEECVKDVAGTLDRIVLVIRGDAKAKCRFVNIEKFVLNDGSTRSSKLKTIEIEMSGVRTPEERAKNGTDYGPSLSFPRTRATKTIKVNTKPGHSNVVLDELPLGEALFAFQTYMKARFTYEQTKGAKPGLWQGKIGEFIKTSKSRDDGGLVNLEPDKQWVSIKFVSPDKAMRQEIAHTPEYKKIRGDSAKYDFVRGHIGTTVVLNKNNRVLCEPIVDGKAQKLQASNVHLLCQPGMYNINLELTATTSSTGCHCSIKANYIIVYYRKHNESEEDDDLAKLARMMKAAKMKDEDEEEESDMDVPGFNENGDAGPEDFDADEF